MNTNVVLSVNGATFDSTKTFNNGAYYFLESNGAIADNALMLSYLTGSTTKANAITVAQSSGASSINMTLAANTLQIAPIL